MKLVSTPPSKNTNLDLHQSASKRSTGSCVWTKSAIILKPECRHHFPPTCRQSHNRKARFVLSHLDGLHHNYDVRPTKWGWTFSSIARCTLNRTIQSPHLWLQFHYRFHWSCFPLHLIIDNRSPFQVCIYRFFGKWSQWRLRLMTWRRFSETIWWDQRTWTWISVLHSIWELAGHREIRCVGKGMSIPRPCNK